MVTTAHLVEKIIEQKPFIQEALSKGIINHAALAEQLLPQIEKELKKKIKFSAVNMAIRRLSEKLEKTFIKKIKFDNQTDINIRSDLIEIVLYKSSNIQEQIKKVYDLVDIKKGDFIAITQGLHEIMIIVNKKYKKDIIKIFPKKSIKLIMEKLSTLTINISEKMLEVQGLFYTLTRALAWENVNIVDIISTFTEMTLIVKEEDIPRSFSTLKKAIGNNK